MIEFEHSLFKILLLVAVLSARPPDRKWTPFIIADGFLLALFTPSIPIATIPWEYILGLTIPLLLWQNARRIITVHRADKWKDMLIWVGAASLFAVLLLSFKALTMPGAILLDLVAVSLIWSAGETDKTSSIVNLIGSFTLIFLLSEVDSFIQTPNHYMGRIFRKNFGFSTTPNKIPSHRLYLPAWH